MSIRNYEEYRKQVLDSLGEDYTVEDLRNFERWRLKVLHGLGNSHVSEDDLLKTYIHKTASGAIATITDGADDVPCKSVKVNIVPKQSGSGDPSPSNVRPISGWDGVEVVRKGKNLLDIPTYAEIMDCPKVSVYYSYAIKVKPNTSYYLSASTINGYTSVGKGFFVLLSSDPIENSNWKSIAHTTQGIVEGKITSSADGYIWLRALNMDESLWNEFTSNTLAQLEEGSTATDYEPYQGTSYPIPLPSTVYGGTLNVTTGELVIDRGIVDLGSLAWDNAGGTRTASASLRSSCVIKENWSPSNPLPKCTKYRYQAVQNGDTTDNIFAFYNGYIYVRDSSFNGDPTAFRNGSQGVMVWYPLANPTTIQLTPTQVNTLLGSNNIWSDAGSVEVEYRADSTLAYNELAATVLENVGN